MTLYADLSTIFASSTILSLSNSAIKDKKNKKNPPYRCWTKINKASFLSLLGVIVAHLI